MLEIIGLIVWALFASWLTAFSVLGYLGTKMFGGHIGKSDGAALALIFAFAIANWYWIFTKTNISITIN